MASPLEAAFDEAKRALDQQVGSLDALRTRASTLLAAATLVTSFLGGQVLAKPSLSGGQLVQQSFTVWSWLAVGSLAGLTIAVLLILLPTGWHFTRSPTKMIAIIDSAPNNNPVTMDGVHRQLALGFDEDFLGNEMKLRWLFDLYKLGCLLIFTETVFWIVELRS
jgi:hypothetical protein